MAKNQKDITRMGRGIRTLKDEVFMPIPGSAYHFVSSRGRIMSTKCCEPIIMKLAKRGRKGDQYLGTVLNLDGERVTVAVHRLMLLVFVGYPPKGMEARHLDGDRFNNTLGNLTWGTLRENRWEDAVRHGTWVQPPALCGSKNPQSKLTEVQVREIKRLSKQEGMTSIVLGKKFNICHSAIRKIRGGETWKHVT